MANFGYDDVLLKWEITGFGKCGGSYSHFMDIPVMLSPDYPFQ